MSELPSVKDAINKAQRELLICVKYGLTVSEATQVLKFKCPKPYRGKSIKLIKTILDEVRESEKQIN